MKIHIPNSAWLGNIDQFLKSFDASEPRKLTITAHKQWISVHPLVLSMVAALGLSCGGVGVTSEHLEAKSKHYLKRMKLFELLKIETDIEIKEHEPAGRFIPLTQIFNNEELTKFITDVIPLLHLKPEQAQPIRYVISELTRNVFEHARSKTGAIVCAQYFKKTNRISIGIVDTGVGIKETISKSYSVKNDLEAIRLALTPGITGTTRRIGGTEFNAGAGLFFIKSIAKTNRNFFVVYSGNALYKLLKTPAGKKINLYGDPYRDKHSGGDSFTHWQGTAVGVDISLDSKEEFTNLLQLINKTYSETVKERKKEFYKKARFI
jgi:anti-sigma regulatory factor (Ser/Thr protein kinase)